MRSISWSAFISIPLHGSGGKRGEKACRERPICEAWDPKEGRVCDDPQGTTTNKWRAILLPPCPVYVLALPCSPLSLTFSFLFLSLSLPLSLLFVSLSSFFSLPLLSLSSQGIKGRAKKVALPCPPGSTATAILSLVATFVVVGFFP